MPRAPLVLIGVLAVTLTLSPLTAPAAILVEDCGNCVDDDGDDLADRRDPDCTPRANGGNAGVGDVSRGKAVTRCAKTTQKAGTKFVLDTAKRMQKCTQAAAACIQLKPGDPSCQQKTAATCAKVLGGIATSGDTLAAAIAGCDADGTVHPDLAAAIGLGFESEEVPCGLEGGAPNLDSTANIAACIHAQHLCRAQHLVGIGTPRARELLIFGGRDADVEFPCLNDVAQADGGNSGVAPDHAKSLLTCSKAIDKLSLVLIGTGAKTVQSCLNAGLACLQVKPTDPNCLTKARAKCAKGFGKLQDPAKGTLAKLAGKFAKACSIGPTLSILDLSDPSGLGLAVQSARCGPDGLGDGSTLSLTLCLGEQTFCEGGYIIERQIPRALELGDLLGVQITGLDF